MKKNFSLTSSQQHRLQQLERQEMLFLKLSKIMFFSGVILTAILMAGILVNVMASSQKQRESQREFTLTFLMEEVCSTS